MSTNEQQSQPASEPKTIDLSKPNPEHGIPALQLVGYYETNRGVVLGFVPRGQNEIGPDDFVSKIVYPNLTAAVRDLQACLDMAFQATATLASTVGYQRGYKAAMNDVAINLKAATQPGGKAASPTLDSDDAAVIDSVADVDRKQRDDAINAADAKEAAKAAWDDEAEEETAPDPLDFSLDLSMSGADSKPTKRKAPTGTINLNAED